MWNLYKMLNYSNQNKQVSLKSWISQTREKQKKVLMEEYQKCSIERFCLWLKIPAKIV